MPSSAKKRKAAKKKMRKEAHNNGAHSQGNDQPKYHDERESDGGEAEREHSEEGAAENHEEGTKEISLGEENAEEIVKEVKAEENLNVATVEAEDVAMGSRNGDASQKHKSSIGSGSEDEEVAIEKEKSVVEESAVVEGSAESVESVEAECEGERSLAEMVASEETPKPVENVSEAVSSENSAPSEMVHNSAEESVAVEELVKEVVSLTSESTFVTESPAESNLMTESVVVENTMASETMESELKQKVEEVLPVSDEKDKNSPAVLELAEEKVETTVGQVVERGSENLPGPVEVTAGENEALLPQSLGVTSAERNGGADHMKESENLKQSDEQPLVSSTPLPVRRTSWMNCCGLFEVLSGGSGR